MSSDQKLIALSLSSAGAKSDQAASSEPGQSSW